MGPQSMTRSSLQGSAAAHIICSKAVIMATAILLTEDSNVEVVPTVDLQEPVHEVTLGSLRVLWSSSGFQHKAVNEHASRACSETIRGDAYIVSDKNLEEVVHMMRMSKRLAFVVNSILQPQLSWKLQPLSSSRCVKLAQAEGKCKNKTHGSAGHLTRVASREHPIHHSVHSQWRVQAVSSHSAGHVAAALHVDHAVQVSSSSSSNPCMSDSTADGRTHAPNALPELPSVPPPWQDLSWDVLGHVATCLPTYATQQLALMQVCTSWRQALLSNSHVIQHTWFALDCQQPFVALGSTAAASNVNPAAVPRLKPFTRRMLPPHTSTGGGHQHPARPIQPVNTSQGGLRQQSRLKAALPQLPLLMKRAIALGNTSALGCMAQLHEVCGQEDQAHRLWQKCAKLGDTEACLHMGIKCYQGLGVPVDSESAQMWLTRGLKKLLGLSHLSLLSVDHLSGTVTLPVSATRVCMPADVDEEEVAKQDGKGKPKPARNRRSASAAAQHGDMTGAAPSAMQGPPSSPPAIQPTVTMPLRELWACRKQAVQALCSSDDSSASLSRPMGRHGITPCIDYDDEHLTAMVASCAVMLAYIHFDGEAGLPVDREQACTLFKLAALCGSNEAARVLGWIFSTGQYGP